jgi:hypothetical protein
MSTENSSGTCVRSCGGAFHSFEIVSKVDKNNLGKTELS